MEEMQIVSQEWSLLEFIFWLLALRVSAWPARVRDT
jgi:hypothetical protein